MSPVPVAPSRGRNDDAAIKFPEDKEPLNGPVNPASVRSVLIWLTDGKDQPAARGFPGSVPLRILWAEIPIVELVSSQSKFVSGAKVVRPWSISCACPAGDVSVIDVAGTSAEISLSLTDILPLKTLFRIGFIGQTTALPM